MTSPRVLEPFDRELPRSATTIFDRSCLARTRSTRLPMPRRRALDRFVRNRIDRRLPTVRGSGAAEAQFHRRAVSGPAAASRSALSASAYTGRAGAS